MKKSASRVDQYIVLGIYSIRNLLCASMKNLQPPKSETLGHVLLLINYMLLKNLMEACLNP